MCTREESSKPVNSTSGCRSISAPVRLQPGRDTEDWTSLRYKRPMVAVRNGLCLLVFRASPPRGLAAHEQTCIFISPRRLPALFCFSRWGCFFFLPSVGFVRALLLSLKVVEDVTSLTRRLSLCRCQNSFTPHEKKSSVEI